MSSSPQTESDRRKFRSRRPAVVAAALAAGALVAGLVAVSPAAAAPTAVQVPATADGNTAATLVDGAYIVQLTEQPVASYSGGLNGFRATKPAPGAGLDTGSAAVRDYSRYLENRQLEVADKVGAEPTYQYTVALNGFAAELTAEQAARLAKSPNVANIVADKAVEVAAEPQGSDAEFLGLDGTDGVWNELGGVDAAGEGVVVGVLDSGIAPENDFFAGDALGTTLSTSMPYIDGDEVRYLKADGDWFSSPMTEDIPEEGWSTDAYSTKLIAAHDYHIGYPVEDMTEGEYLSPRDYDGHGSHTASTAAGDYGVTGEVSGTEYEDLSGVAPAAKVASYKVCWKGTDPTVNASCYFSDTVAGIEQAVEDGVDVLNFSVGGSTDTVWDPVDEAFFGAASAGVFVAVAGGNSGPTTSTVEHGSPWYTTVAASSWGGFLGTLTLGNGESFAGPTVTLPDTLEAGFVASVDAAIDPEDPAVVSDAQLCAPNSLDPALVEGSILLCDRGTYLFTEKIDEAERVGAAGLIIVNINADNNGTQAMEGDIPIIHLPVEARNPMYDYIADANEPTATMTPGDVDGLVPAPQIADFSSRGPILSAGGDMIKPDLAAPGVDILAAVSNEPGADGEYGVLSGTSMATPHVAGFAALYLGAHPKATPAEIKSAMMTTARDTVDADGAKVKDPFDQGAGNVVPAKFLDPGLVVLNGPADWMRFVNGTGDATFPGAGRIDPSNFNSPSIAIGDLVDTETVKRTVTATEKGTWTAKVNGVSGVDVTVSPSTVKLSKGQSATIKVTFDRTDAPLDEYTTGFLSLKKPSGSKARMPIAVHPSSVVPDTQVNGTGTHGSVDVAVTGGFDGSVDLQPEGLVVGDTTIYEDTMPGDYQLDPFTLTDENGTLVSLSVSPVESDPLNDLDLLLYQFDEAQGGYVLYAASATAAASESLTLTLPAGDYIVEIDTYDGPETGTDVAYSRLIFDESEYEGSFAADPDPLPVREGGESSYELSWKGLEPGTVALGFVYYGDTSPYSTLVQIDATATAVLNEQPPTISGDAEVGGELEVDLGEWEYPNDELDFTYQWLRDGDAIDGAEEATYSPTNADVGHDVSVLVSASYDGGEPGVAESDAVTVLGATTTSFSVTPDPVTKNDAFDVTVTVHSSAIAKPTGFVRVAVGNQAQTLKLQKFHSGTVVAHFSKRRAGTYPIEVAFTGGDGLAPSSVEGELVVIP